MVRLRNLTFGQAAKICERALHALGKSNGYAALASVLNMLTVDDLEKLELLLRSRPPYYHADAAYIGEMLKDPKRVASALRRFSEGASPSQIKPANTAGAEYDLCRLWLTYCSIYFEIKEKAKVENSTFAKSFRDALDKKI